MIMHLIALVSRYGFPPARLARYVSQRPFDRSDRVESRRVEDRHRAISLADKQHDFGAT